MGSKRVASVRRVNVFGLNNISIYNINEKNIYSQHENDEALHLN